MSQHVFVSAVVGEQSRIHVTLTDTVADPLHHSNGRQTHVCQQYGLRSSSHVHQLPLGETTIFHRTSTNPSRLLNAQEMALSFQALGVQLRGPRGERVLIGGNSKRT